MKRLIEGSRLHKIIRKLNLVCIFWVIRYWMNIVARSYLLSLVFVE